MLNQIHLRPLGASKTHCGIADTTVRGMLLRDFVTLASNQNRSGLCVACCAKIDAMFARMAQHRDAQIGK